ncbi:hypothetical protein AB205_0117120 [Aquarana catesbeiana]|uniref:Uncharacterized protein n=1 Tax=Aquarana catesbeiana TaxID=8400 RepID=A0A2G9NCF6_AQUCT|nr:hypothetical protein AB205_0117120 [Aquarana catesbeiana]
MCETCPKKGKYSSLVKGINNVFNLELCPNRQLYPTSKQCFTFIFMATNICAKYIFCFILIGEKRLGTLEDNRNPPPLKEGEQRTPQSEDVEEGEVKEVIEIVPTTGDVQVVEEQSTHVNSDSAQRLIQNIMWCSWDLDLINEKTKEIEQRLKNMIDVLGRI